MQRLRLLWVSHLVPYPPKSGVHLRAFNLLKATAESQDVDLVAFIQPQWMKMFFADVETGLQECHEQLMKYCKSVAFLPIESQDRSYGKLRTAIESLLPGPCYSVRWLQGRKAAAIISSIYQREEHDLAHFDTIGLAPYRALMPRAPATLGHHNIESHMLLRRAGNESNLLKKAYFLQEGYRLREFERKVADQFTRHITCSDLDSQRLRMIAPACHAVTVPNGVDTKYFQASGAAVVENSAIFVGSFNWYPNAAAAEYLLTAIWPLVLAAAPEARLDLVGSGPSERLRALAGGLRGVKVHGFVDDVRPFIDAAAVYVCPIRDGGGLS